METLIAVGIVGIVIVAILGAFKSTHDLWRDLAKAGEVEELRYFVRNNIDCGAALAAAAVCEPGAYVDLKDQLGAPLSDGGNSSIRLAGNLRIRGYCQDEGGKSLRVEYARGRSEDNKDEWRDLFEGIPLVCCGGFDNVKDTLGTAQIKKVVADRLGVTLGANDHIFADTEAVAEVCLLAGYNRSTTYTWHLATPSNCAAQRFGFFRKGGREMFFRDTCIPNKLVLDTVTCQEKRPPGCEDKCPATYNFTDSLGLADFISSHHPAEVPYAFIGPSQALLGENYDTVVLYQQVSALRPKTSAAACALRGYAKSAITNVGAHSSPENNVLTVWDEAKGKWNPRNALLEGNIRIEGLRCTSPFPTCRIGP